MEIGGDPDLSDENYILIWLAQGQVMKDRRCDAAEALRWLQVQARQRQVKLIVIAFELVRDRSPRRTRRLVRFFRITTQRKEGNVQ